MGDGVNPSTPKYKAGDWIHVEHEGYSLLVNPDTVDAANAAAASVRAATLREVDEAAEACGLDGDTRTIYFFNGERYADEAGAFPEVKAWGVELYKDAGVEHHWGGTFTEALFAAAGKASE